MGMNTPAARIYDPADVAVFWKTKERFGGLSNMAAGFPLRVNGFQIRTSEALYQACRFPHRPDLQELILSQTSPMTAKMKGKPYSSESRPDWFDVRVPIMRWSLRVKLCQNPRKFGDALVETIGMDIVEKKVRRSDFWGAKVQDTGMLKGPNVLGRLLMELRKEFRSDGAPQSVPPLNIPRFELFGEQIDEVVIEQQEVEFQF